MASLRAMVQGPHAKAFGDAYSAAARERAQRERDEAAQDAGLAQLLQGQENQARLVRERKAREGEEAIGAINEFMRTNPELQERLGRRVEGSMPAGVAGPGAPVYNPYQASGAGAPFLADMIKQDIVSASAEGRTQAQQEATLRNLLLKAGIDRETLGITEGGKDRRLEYTEGGADRRLDVTEGGRDRRFKIGEKGKYVRSAGRDAAISGETTFRAQMNQLDNYIKTLKEQRTTASNDLILAGKDPARRAPIQQRIEAIDREIEAATNQFREALQPRSPHVTQPVPGQPGEGLRELVDPNPPLGTIPANPGASGGWGRARRVK